MQGYKRKILSFALVAACVLFSFSCTRENERKEAEKEDVASVVFTDVGEGDCAYVLFPDGKNLLIDCGSESEIYYDKISRIIRAGGKDSIDTLILTNAEEEHVGGAARIIKEFGVKRAYIPYIVNVEAFSSYRAATEALIECGAERKISASGETVTGENYFYTILSPEPPDVPFGEYDEFNFSADPSKSARKNISATVYMEYFGVRFLFSGDSGKSVESKIILNYDSGLFDHGAKRKIALENVDFLKVADHGSSGSSSEEFIMLLSPLNAVLSVGYNYNGHPSTETLKRIWRANPQHRLFRTDVVGSVGVYLQKDGKYTVKTENENV